MGTSATARHAEDQLRDFFESAPDAMIAAGDDGAIIVANSQATRLFGYERSVLEGLAVERLVPAGSRAAHRAHRADFIDDPHTRPMGSGLELSAVRHDGTEFPAEISLSTIDLEGRRLTTAAIRDITDRRRGEAARRAAEDRFRIAFREAAVPSAIVGLQGAERGIVLEANPAYAEMLGCAVGDVVGSRLVEWIHPDERDAHDRPLGRLASEPSARLQFERRYRHVDGHLISTIVNAATFRDERGRLVAIGQVLDISERKRFESELRHLADHDPLTGLYNRRRFEEELERALLHAQRYGSHGALLALDLDGFKFVNDSLGHAAGDELVARIATGLHDGLRETDIVARTGGDEFAVILPETTELDATRVAEKLLSGVRNRGSIVRDDRRVHVTASVGITTFAAEAGRTRQDLMAEADIAMYDAKAAGRDQVAVYRNAGRRREHIASGDDWAARLRAALEQQRFVLHAQPIVPVCSDGVRRFELLLRLIGEHGELIPPAAFLYRAERSGLIESIDHWVMAEAVRLLAKHEAAGKPISLSTNMSAKTLTAGGVAAHLERLLADTNVAPGSLVVELTETTAISNLQLARELAHDLRLMGVRVALDDFGAGFATFHYLKHVAFDYVKIAGEFIEHLPVSRPDQLVVRSIVELAHGLGADTVAESVRDDATLRFLRGQRVGYAQGFHTGPPGPLELTLPAA